MGAWGATLYANDTACDVRDTYLGFLREQLSNDEAYQNVLNEFRDYAGSDEEPLFGMLSQTLSGVSDVLCRK